ncbi:hypothetical protein D3C85_1010620 [compost metagenome]
MDAAGVAALGLVHGEELLHFGEDLREVAGLVAAAGLDGVAVHGVGTPQHLPAFALHLAHQARHMGFDLVRAHAHDQVEAAGVVVRVEDVDQADQLLAVHARPHLDADGVAHAAQELHMGAVQLAGTVADPEHVRRAVVPTAGEAVAAHEGFFVVQQQGFMGGEEAGFAQLRRAVQAAGTHERQGLVDATRQLAVLFGQCRVGDEVEVPLMHLVHIGETALGEGAQQVEGGGGLVVGLQQALRVGHAAGGVEADAVDDVATVGGQGDIALGLAAGGARLGELAGHAAHLHHRAAGGKGHDDGHLQQHLEGVADLRGGEFDEAFRAITTLEQEGAALGDLGELAAQFARLAGEHQRRVARQGLLDMRQFGGVRVLGLLLDGFVPPAFWAPFWAAHQGLDTAVCGR